MTKQSRINDGAHLRDVRMSEWEHFRACGYHFDAMPEVLGISEKEWVATYTTAQKYGDRRATGRPHKVQGGQEAGPITRYGSGLRSGRVLMPNSRS